MRMLLINTRMADAVKQIMSNPKIGNKQSYIAAWRKAKAAGGVATVFFASTLLSVTLLQSSASTSSGPKSLKDLITSKTGLDLDKKKILLLEDIDLEDSEGNKVAAASTVLHLA